MLRVLITALAAVPLLSSSVEAGLKQRASYFLYAGTYTSETSRGIYAWRFQPGTGEITALGLAGEASNPSFLAIHPNRQYLYAVREVEDYQGKSGAVTAFAVDGQSGKLHMLNTVSSRGAGPCYVAVDRSGRDVLVANYSGGSVAVLPLREDGRLGPASFMDQHHGSGTNPVRQKEPHAHSINVSPDNRFALSADLGLDRVFVYRFDPVSATLTQWKGTNLKPGSGPRHFTFDRNGRRVYVINELASTVTAFAYDHKNAELRELQTVSTLPPGFHGDNSTAEIVAHPNGKFLYGSNRGHDSIAVFEVNRKGDPLRLIANTPTEGSVPRNFAIDPTGRFLFAANQKSGNIVVFRIDPKSGALTPTGQKLEVSSPVCIRFVPTL